MVSARKINSATEPVETSTPKLYQLVILTPQWNQWGISTLQWYQWVYQLKIVLFRIWGYVNFTLVFQLRIGISGDIISVIIVSVGGVNSVVASVGISILKSTRISGIITLQAYFLGKLINSAMVVIEDINTPLLSVGGIG